MPDINGGKKIRFVTDKQTKYCFLWVVKMTLWTAEATFIVNEKIIYYAYNGPVIFK